MFDAGMNDSAEFFISGASRHHGGASHGMMVGRPGVQPACSRAHELIEGDWLGWG